MVLTSVSGITFEEAWHGRHELIVEGERVPFLGLRQYVKNKRAAGRTKDALDLALLEEAGLLPDDV